MAFQQLDQLKIQIGNAIRKFKKEQISQCSQDDQKTFETWYWKMVPLMQVDMTPYTGKSIRVYDPPEENQQPPLINSR